MTLNKAEKERYHRHLILPGFGKERQEKLKNASILMIGAGGLSCPALQYLVAAGVGTIGIVDGDDVDISNLHRQILFDETDVGESKAETAAKKLKKQNPHVQFHVHKTYLVRDNAMKIMEPYDLIIDGSDNFGTRYLVNDACVLLDKPFVYGAIYTFDGQVSVFNYQDGPTYRCLFPEAPPADEVPNCADIGVLGILPGMVGTMQATEAIKVLTGIGEPLSGKLLLYDALQMQFSSINIKAIPSNKQLKDLADQYDISCANDLPEAASITANELSERLNKGEDIFLVDVREPFEHEICKLTDHLFPLRSIEKYAPQIPVDKPVVVYCHHGMRSASAIAQLKERHGFTNLINLEGGIHAWSEDVDWEMEQY